MLGQWPVRSEHAEEVNGHAKSAGVLAQLRALEGGWRKRQGWDLAKPQELLFQPVGVSHSRAVSKLRLERSNGAEEVERVRPRSHFGHQTIWRLPIRLGHRIISPRRGETISVSVKEFIET